MIDHDYSSVLGSPRAQMVLADVQAHPGTVAHETATRLKLSYQIVCAMLRCLRYLNLVLTAGPQQAGNRGMQAATYRLSDTAHKGMLPDGVKYHRRRADHRAAFTRQVVLDSIRMHGPVTRQELVTVSGVGHSTLGSYIQPLVAAGAVTAVYRNRVVVYALKELDNAPA